MEIDIPSLMRTVVIGCLALAFISSVMLPAAENLARVALAVFIAIVAAIGYSIHLFGVIAVLKVAGYFAGLLACMLSTGFLVSVVRNRRAERTFKLRQSRVLERFPEASKLEVHRICVSLERGKTLADFHWDGKQVILGAGENARIAGPYGWISLNAAAPEYVYLAQQIELDNRLQKIEAKLSAADHHALCALLYFNWEVLELTVDRENNALLVILGRRADTRYERYPLRMAESTA